MIGVTINGYNKLILNLEAIHEDALLQGVTGNVRFQVAQLIMFPNDYIMTEKDSYRREFEGQRARVDDNLRKLRAFKLSSDERAIVDSIAVDIDSIYAYAHRIFSIPRPRSSTEAPPLMETMDYRFGTAMSRKTTRILDIVFHRIAERKIESVRVKEQVLNTILCVFFPVLLISIVVTYLSSKRIGKPILALAKAARAIANGDYSQRPAVTTRDELALLARSFSQMAEAIEVSHRKLELSKSFSENIVATVPSGLVAIGKKSEVISVNRSFCELFVLRREQVEGSPVDTVLRTIGLPQECRDAVARRNPFRNLECTCSSLTKGKLTLNLTLSGIRVAAAEEEGLLLVIDDITEREQRAEQLKKLSSVIEQTADNVFITNRDGVIEYVNPAFEKLTGYTKQEVIGKTPRILKSGKCDREFYRELWGTILSGRVFHAEIVNKKKNGELFYEIKTISPIVDANGNITHFVSSGKDITEQRILEEQFRQAQKMESIGRLAGGITHDFNNLLGVVLGYTQLVMRKLEKENPLYRYIELIDSAAKKATTLTRQLLAFARRENITPKPINLNDAIPELIKLLRRTIGEEINVKFIPGSKVWNISMDPAQLDQVLINLASNARDAMGGAGTILIETSNCTLKGGEKIGQMDMKAGDYVVMSFTDNGKGMSKNILDKIFEPFFTTKPSGQGTGLGLSTVYGIVKQNEGAIDVYSEENVGTTFKIYLPRYYGEVVPEDAEEEGFDLSGTETILIVEDQAELLELAKNILEEHGYKVLTALTPSEGILLSTAYGGEINLLLTDVIMPNMNGKELQERILSIRPGTKTLFMSGYTGDIISYRGVLEKGVNFIPKPFTPFGLLKKIKEVLES